MGRGAERAYRKVEVLRSWTLDLEKALAKVHVDRSIPFVSSRHGYEREDALGLKEVTADFGDDLPQRLDEGAYFHRADSCRREERVE